MRNRVVLPAPLGPITPTIAAARQIEGAIRHEVKVLAVAAIALMDVLDAEHLVAQPRAGGNLNDRLALRVEFLVAGQLVVRFDAGLVLLQAPLVRVMDPVQFAFEGFLPLRLLLFRDPQQLEPSARPKTNSCPRRAARGRPPTPVSTW